MIVLEDVKKAYGPVQALRGISFQVAEGEIVGLLGPNGAGKTTAIKILTGYLHPDAGHVSVDGLDVLTQPREAQARIGYLPENTPLYPTMTVQGYLKMMADMRNIPPDAQRGLIAEAIEATGLVEHRARPIGNLSKGLKQRVGLAQAILHKPRLLILDEPTVGLDPTQIVEIRELILRLAEESTILFSSHILPEVEAVCDRVVMIFNGEVRADNHLDELAATPDMVVVFGADVPGAQDALKALPGVTGVTAFETIDRQTGYRVRGAEGADLSPAIYDLAREKNWPLRELRRDVLTLEAVFNRLATA
ncbi:MAG: ABC transporter ATP-binding protein [Anaerolineales bacterium]